VDHSADNNTIVVRLHDGKALADLQPLLDEHGWGTVPNNRPTDRTVTIRLPLGAKLAAAEILRSHEAVRLVFTGQTIYYRTCV
jgi:hypothetical protein